MSLTKSTNTVTKALKAYSALTPSTKQAINQVAQRTASIVAKQVAGRNSGRQRNNVRRTRMGQRIYSPEDSLSTKAVAPVSYATMWQSGAKSMRVKQTEVLGYIKAANKTWNDKKPWKRVGDYSVVTLPINPADPYVFPWLSHIARLYDKYRFHSLKFRYINSVSTSQPGNIAFALDYDTLDEAPNSIMEASQSAKYQIGPTYCPQEFVVPVSHPGNNPWLYTFDVNVDSKTVDLKTYNLGNLFVMINGVKHGDDISLGWIAVDYDVELLDKNPVENDKIFASQTLDSAAPASKKTRSNVDPADTMSATFTWGHPDEESETNECTIVFSDDVAVGSKMRLGINLLAELTNSEETSQTAYLVLEEHTLPEGVQVLEGYSPVARAQPSSTVGVMGYWNLDITLPENRTVQFEVRSSNYTKVKFNDSGDYNKYYIAYTYA